MALKSGTSSSPLKTKLKNITDGNVYTKTLEKRNYTPKKVASGNVSSSPVSLKTEPSSGGLK